MEGRLTDLREGVLEDFTPVCLGVPYLPPQGALRIGGHAMIRFAGRGILLDIEGTAASHRFVQEELFGFARQQLFAFLRFQWNNPEVREVRDLIAREAGEESFLTFAGGPNVPPEYMFNKLRQHVAHLMNIDAKTTGLKQLQGLIWRDGFQKGELRGHVYDDVPLALEAWGAAGRLIRIYSSGSILSQQLYFKHTKFGDLTKSLSGHYDTTAGPKKEEASYKAIAADWQLPPGDILFLSDVVAELDAAREAGLHTGLLLRPENPPVEKTHDHPALKSFAEIEMA